MSTTTIVCLAIAVAVIWGWLVTVVLWSHNNRLRSFDERMAARSHLMRSYRAGCSCWQDETGLSACNRCAS